MIKMTTTVFIIKILATLLFGGFIVWGYWHEDKFVEFEDLLIRAIRVYFKRRRQRKLAQKNMTYTKTSMQKPRLHFEASCPKGGCNPGGPQNRRVA
jgi:hypothetical protein